MEVAGEMGPPDDITEPELPQLPSFDGPLNHSRHAQLIFNDSFHLGTSSDPPVFSSDDVTPSAENYSARREKSRRIGPWWQPGVSVQHPRKKRKIQRNYDSGIFMGSEASLASSDIPSSELDRIEAQDEEDAQFPLETTIRHTNLTASKRPRGGSSITELETEPSNTHSSRDMSLPRDRARKRSLPNKAQALGQSNPAAAGRTETRLCVAGVGKSKRLANSTSVPRKDAANERHVHTIIEKSVEEGSEDINLNGVLLWLPVDRRADFLDDALQPLQQLVKTRRFDDPGRYEAMVPDIRLFLNANELEKLPMEIFRLKNVTELSLRNNRLRTLDWRVASIPRLRNLNLCSNQIRWLPAEIRRTMVWDGSQFDNKFLQLDTNYLADYIPSEHRAPHYLRKLHPVEGFWEECRAISQISYLDIRGLAVPKSVPRPSLTPLFRPNVAAFRPSTSMFDSLSTKSLLELSVAKMSKIASDQDISVEQYVRDSDYLYDHVKRAWEVRETGNQCCCVCSRAYVIPRAEWFEWHSGTRERIPLLFRACSWACALDRELHVHGIFAADERDSSGDEAASQMECGWKWQA